MEELTMFLDIYFNKNKKSKLGAFFKFDNLNVDKIEFIEKEKLEEEKYINVFILNIQYTYDNRLELYNKNKDFKRAKSKTTLVINSNIKVKIKEALESIGEIGFNNAFMAYTDAVLKNEITPSKFLPYFLKKQYGEYGVIETYLDRFNIDYGYKK